MVGLHNNIGTKNITLGIKMTHVSRIFYNKIKILKWYKTINIITMLDILNYYALANYDLGILNFYRTRVANMNVFASCVVRYNYAKS